MAYPFIQARHRTTGALRPPRAILWHMAEGGGTVGYLRHTPRDVSAHFVVQGGGRIVQMVRLSDAAHSAHVSIDAGDNDATDCNGLYRPGIARSLLGAAGWADINRYVVAVEVEGFRRDGPSDDQADAMAALAANLRARFPSLVGNLGHRDVQDYKGCPGCRFPWGQIGGHGRFQEVPIVSRPITDPAPALISALKGRPIYDVDGRGVLTSLTVDLVDRLSPFGADPFRAMFYTRGGIRFLGLVEPTSVRPVPDPPDCEAVEAELDVANARIVAAQAALAGDPTP